MKDTLESNRQAYGDTYICFGLIPWLCRDTNLHTSLLGFQIAAAALRSANRAHAEGGYSPCLL